MKLDPQKTALLTLDLQKGVFGFVPDSERVMRRAFDLDFRSVVLKDACFDADQEVHRVLTEKVFPAHAWVAHASAQRLARGPPRRKEALFDLLLLIHTGFIPVRRRHDNA
jgi:hypothetical protein